MRAKKKLDLITASGKKQMDYLSKYINKEKIVYLPLGIDTQFYRPPSNNKLRLSEKVILHVGKNRRDFQTLKKVFLKIQKKYPNVILEMVGNNQAESIFRDIKNVKFHSFVNDEGLLEIYQRATILLLPLFEGGSSQTFNEAMATGLPIVTNNLPNLEDYFPPNDSIYLSSTGDVQMMTAQSIELLDNPKLWDKVSRNLREHSKSFDYQTIREKLITIYKDRLKIKIINPVN